MKKQVKQLMSPRDFASWQMRGSKEAREAAAWIEGTNPLRGMTVSGTQRLFDAARNGDTVHLQWLYNEIEQVMPALFICAERRNGALAVTDWDIATHADTRTRGWDDVLAAEQADVLNKAFGGVESSNWTDFVEHLSLAFFRGFAHTAPLYSRDGLSLTGFDILKNWNFCRDIPTGDWYWNPGAAFYLSGFAKSKDLQFIPRDEICSLVRPRHINYPGMSICLRAGLGESSWGKFVDRYGIPPVIIIMPPDIDPALKNDYRDAARDVADGGTGALPYGSAVSYASEGRGVDPFTGFLNHQQELIVLMATGGMLTSLTGATGIGQGATDAHQETWRMIMMRDASVIGAAVNRQIARIILNRAFPGKPHLVYFTFATEATPTPSEVLDDAIKAKSAGYVIDAEQLEEKTGYRLQPAPEPATGSQGFGFGESSYLPTLEQTAPQEVASAALNGAQISSIVSVVREAAAGTIPVESVLPTLTAAFPAVPEATLREIVNPLIGFTAAPGAQNAQPVRVENAGTDETPPQRVAKPLQNARSASDVGTAGSASPEGTQRNVARLAESYAEDMNPLAVELEALLELPDAELANAAAALSKKLPALMAENPSAATALQTIMESVLPGDASGATRVENENPNRASDGQFTTAGGDQTGGARPREPETKGTYDRFGSTDEPTLNDNPRKNIARGDAALDSVQSRKQDIQKAMYRDETGWIGFEWGDAGSPKDDFKSGHGISHIAAKHRDDLKELTGVLANGAVYTDAAQNKLFVVKDSRYAVLVPNGKSKTLVLTEYITTSNRIEAIKKLPRAKPGTTY